MCREINKKFSSLSLLCTSGAREHVCVYVLEGVHRASFTCVRMDYCLECNCGGNKGKKEGRKGRRKGREEAGSEVNVYLPFPLLFSSLLPSLPFPSLTNTQTNIRIRIIKVHSVKSTRKPSERNSPWDKNCSIINRSVILVVPWRWWWWWWWRWWCNITNRTLYKCVCSAKCDVRNSVWFVSHSCLCYAKVQQQQQQHSDATACDDSSAALCTWQNSKDSMTEQLYKVL